MELAKAPRETVARHDCAGASPIRVGGAGGARIVLPNSFARGKVQRPPFSFAGSEVAIGDQGSQPALAWAYRRLVPVPPSVGSAVVDGPADVSVAVLGLGPVHWGFHALVEVADDGVGEVEGRGEVLFQLFVVLPILASVGLRPPPQSPAARGF